MSSTADPIALPLPPTSGGRPDPEGVSAWVADHLGDVIGGATARPPTSDRSEWRSARGGQQAADAALAAFDPTGYAERRNEVWPLTRRGASGLSPWVRHGLLTLSDLWAHVADAPAADRDRFRDELLWQEYARHLYARLGASTGASLRFEVPEHTGSASFPAADVAHEDVTPDGLACLQLVATELATTGWLPNQARMWAASWWVAHAGGGWRDGEDWLFAHLLDGSRAANRLGWQWVAGSATGTPWVLARHHVERRAPGLCDGCARRSSCPLEHGATSESPPERPADPRLDRHPEGEPGGDAVTGPAYPSRTAEGPEPEVVWLTAESLGDADPALSAHPELPAVFVFDVPLLTHLGLSAARLGFLAETLADLGTRREVQLWRGDPVDVLASQHVAVTFAPVPGFATRAAAIDPAAVHPWPWLMRPAGAPLRSFSSWRRAMRA